MTTGARRSAKTIRNGALKKYRIVAHPRERGLYNIADLDGRIVKTNLPFKEAQTELARLNGEPAPPDPDDRRYDHSRGPRGR
jgi:hypothetical protein